MEQKAIKKGMDVSKNLKQMNGIRRSNLKEYLVKLT